MLTLTSSKLQRGVSNIFDHIGFDNILEHVIDTNEIKCLKAQGSSSPGEFLSIDIANVEKKIEIKVDGWGTLYASLTSRVNPPPINLMTMARTKSMDPQY